MVHSRPSDDDDDYGDLFPEVRHLRRFFHSLHRRPGSCQNKRTAVVVMMMTMMMMILVMMVMTMKLCLWKKCTRHIILLVMIGKVKVHIETFTSPPEIFTLK